MLKSTCGLEGVLVSEETSIKEMELLCEEAYQLRHDVDQLEDAAKEKRAQLDELNSKILLLLEAHGKTSWQTPLASFDIRERVSVRTPKTDEEKRQLFEWLQNKGIFWSTVSVNSQTLNGLYKSELESAAHDGREFNIPGLQEPEIFKQIIIRKKR